ILDIDYFTFTDGFLLLSFSILFSTDLESLDVYWLIILNNDKLARKMDIFSRVAFPISYLVLITSLYFIYLH
ncbi:hypothetical protein IFN73_11465, partial [Francisella tularensis subsp. holarctica]|nr:hypothetical protein [Francisella tularensis subsp. holarctica]